VVEPAAACGGALFEVGKLDSQLGVHAFGPLPCSGELPVDGGELGGFEARCVVEQVALTFEQRVARGRVELFELPCKHAVAEPL
jgi:hypothetical protein